MSRHSSHLPCFYLPSSKKDLFVFVFHCHCLSLHLASFWHPLFLCHISGSFAHSLPLSHRPLCLLLSSLTSTVEQCEFQRCIKNSSFKKFDILEQIPINSHLVKFKYCINMLLSTTFLTDILIHQSPDYWEIQRWWKVFLPLQAKQTPSCLWCARLFVIARATSRDIYYLFCHRATLYSDIWQEILILVLNSNEPAFLPSFSHGNWLFFFFTVKYCRSRASCFRLTLFGGETWQDVTVCSASHRDVMALRWLFITVSLSM